jgi:hypothetical protein
VKLGATGQIDGAGWQLVSRSLHAWSAQQHDVRLTDLGLRITYLPSEAGQETYSDFAVPFNGQSRPYSRPPAAIFASALDEVNDPGGADSRR